MIFRVETVAFLGFLCYITIVKIMKGGDDEYGKGI
jgi:hypothetical protein